MKNVLFITWDGPETNYMEGLFIPILDEVQKQSNYKFHIIQFTWANKKQTNLIKKNTEKLGIIYYKKTIFRKPSVILGSILSVLSGIYYLKKYLKKNKIDVVMPRSTMPALMVNYLKKQNFKLLFDADGLPLEERIDFSNLTINNNQYKFLKKVESKILVKADGVITRSKKAIEIHLATIGKRNFEKFSVVINGRNKKIFMPNDITRKEMRTSLKILNNEKVFIYCGSLGQKYGWSEMISIFENYLKKHVNSKFIILTGNLEFAKKKLPIYLKEVAIIKKVPFDQIPKYLSIADVAFAIITPKYSMKAAAAIKLGEYLLMGIPTIASLGIGDTDEILNKIPNCFGFNHELSENINDAILFVENLKNVDNEEIRKAAIPFFSLESSALSYISALNKL